MRWHRGCAVWLPLLVELSAGVSERVEPAPLCSEAVPAPAQGRCAGHCRGLRTDPEAQGLVGAALADAESPELQVGLLQEDEPSAHAECTSAACKQVESDHPLVQGLAGKDQRSVESLAPGAPRVSLGELAGLAAARVRNPILGGLCGGGLEALVAAVIALVAAAFYFISKSCTGSEDGWESVPGMRWLLRRWYGEEYKGHRVLVHAHQLVLDSQGGSELALGGVRGYFLAVVTRAVGKGTTKPPSSALTEKTEKRTRLSFTSHGLLENMVVMCPARRPELQICVFKKHLMQKKEFVGSATISVKKVVGDMPREESFPLVGAGKDSKRIGTLKLSFYTQRPGDPALDELASDGAKAGPTLGMMCALQHAYSRLTKSRKDGVDLAIDGPALFAAVLTGNLRSGKNPGQTEVRYFETVCHKGQWYMRWYKRAGKGAGPGEDNEPAGYVQLKSVEKVALFHEAGFSDSIAVHWAAREKQPRGAILLQRNDEGRAFEDSVKGLDELRFAIRKLVEYASGPKSAEHARPKSSSATSGSSRPDSSRPDSSSSDDVPENEKKRRSSNVDGADRRSSRKSARSSPRKSASPSPRKSRRSSRSSSPAPRTDRGDEVAQKIKSSLRGYEVASPDLHRKSRSREASPAPSEEASTEAPPKSGTLLSLPTSDARPSPRKDKTVPGDTGAQHLTPPKTKKKEKKRDGSDSPPDRAG